MSITNPAPGQFKVSPNETVTVQIVKSQAPYNAATSDLDGATWTQQPGNIPGQLTANGTFRAPANQGDTANFSIVFNFAPAGSGNSAGDTYAVTISGIAASSITGPGFTSRTYFFEVA